MKLTIGARPSVLAQVQAESVRSALAARLNCAIELVAISTSGDRMLTPLLAQVGGKGLFIRELEQALCEHRIDLAVHSMKDLPAALDSRFRLAAIPLRENPWDALVGRAPGGVASLRENATVGTASARRRWQLLLARPDLTIAPLRGNIDNRLRKLESGDFDAIILAMAGLNRLGLARDLRITQLDDSGFVPAAGQGALAIETLAEGPIGDSIEFEEAVAALSDRATEVEVTAERAVLAGLGASCVSPIGVKAALTASLLRLDALLFSPDGARRLRASLERPADADPGALGDELANQMRLQGAGELIGDG